MCARCGCHAHSHSPVTVAVAVTVRPCPAYETNRATPAHSMSTVSFLLHCSVSTGELLHLKKQVSIFDDLFRRNSCSACMHMCFIFWCPAGPPVCWQVGWRVYSCYVWCWPRAIKWWRQHTRLHVREWFEHGKYWKPAAACSQTVCLYGSSCTESRWYVLRIPTLNYPWPCVTVTVTKNTDAQSLSSYLAIRGLDVVVVLASPKSNNSTPTQLPRWFGVVSFVCLNNLIIYKHSWFMC